jgi:small subunit ribosomal protein S4
LGAPKRFRKKYEKPTLMWDKQRIESEHKLKERYGLRNLKEVWQAASELRRIRRNVREVLSGRAGEEVGKEIIARLAKYNVVSASATLDDLLVIDLDAMLNRRLQSVVVTKGMARSMRQARQLITHGFISVNSKRVTTPGYMVSLNEESRIGYYKPIKITSEQQPKAKEEPQKAKEEAKTEQ